MTLDKEEHRLALLALLDQASVQGRTQARLMLELAEAIEKATLKLDSVE